MQAKPLISKPIAVRRSLLAGDEIALIDVRNEAMFATGHPLFAAQMPLAQLEAEARWRIPRATTPIVLYDDGEGLVEQAFERLKTLGFAQVSLLDGGLAGWRAAGFELFQDVNSYAKAFGELVEHRCQTPSLPASAVEKLIRTDADIVILDARRFEEYRQTSIPTGVSVPSAELVLHACTIAPDPETVIIVNCAGRTRSIIGAQSLVNAGVPNPVYALRDGTIGWRLAGLSLARGQECGAPSVGEARLAETRTLARAVADQAGVRRVDWAELRYLETDGTRTLYRFDVRQRGAYNAGHLPGFRHAEGGQLIHEIDYHAPVRGARVVLADDLGPRADMTASWLAQLGCEVFVFDGGWSDVVLATGSDGAPPARNGEGAYDRSYAAPDCSREAMQAYLDWEAGLVEQLGRDGTHGFFVI